MRTKTAAAALALVAGLALAGAAGAQASGGPDAKGNAPLKPSHTVNDGTAKRGANSFTEAQARQHIERSGFTNVTGLVKGDDGVWRGQGSRAGATVDVALDFKGNVSTPALAAGGASPSASPAAAAGRTTTTTTTTAARGGDSSAPPATGAAPMRRRHHIRHHHRASCTNPSLNGAACSGVDRNRNGISDREDRAIRAGAHP